MWERISKLPLQIVAAFLIIVLSFGLLYLLPFKQIPKENHDVFTTLIGTVIGSCLTPVIGWLYTTSKSMMQQQQQKQNQQ